jgi:AraC family transcriptional regulator
MTNKDVILKSIRYIEENLKSEITVLSCAQEVCYSLYHYIRLFQSVTGYSPKNYIQQRRLSEAAQELMNSDRKIADLAFEYQFNSHEAFTRAFTKLFGFKPTEIRNKQALTVFPLVKPITEDFIFQSEKARNQPPEKVELEEKMLAGIAFFVPDDSDGAIIPEKWAEFLKEVNDIPHRVVPERFYQIQYWSNVQEIGGLYFFVGLEISSIAGLKPEYVLKTIPRGRYLRFIHRGLANKVGYTYKYIYNQYLPDSDHVLNLPFNFEFYGEKCKGPNNPDSESEIYIPIE